MSPSEDSAFSVDKNLEDWLKERSNSDFPKTTSSSDTYFNRYQTTSDKLKPIHQEVEKGALLESIIVLYEKGEIDESQIIYLNNHDERHVKTVIERASELLKVSECKLTAYEGYLLLMAIQFHDVGIIYGRKNHEKKCWEIMRGLGPGIGLDRAEQLTIIKIAAVHGGVISGNKDKISRLKETVDLMGEKNIRKRFLAALLRFSDELADDSSRATSYLAGGGKIPSSSEIFHKYSESLQNVTIYKNEIKLSFYLEENTALKKFTKNSNRTYLVDEIYCRTLKMHLERLYCMRFMRPHIEINRIRVDVEIYCGDDILEPHRITYTLQEEGYPDYKPTYINKLCPDLKKHTGPKVKKFLNNRRVKS